MTTSFVSPPLTVTPSAVALSASEWEKAMTSFYDNFYRIQTLLSRPTKYKPKQVKEFKAVQQLMLTALAELHEDLDSPLPVSRTLTRHTEIVTALNGRVEAIFAQA